MKAITILPAFVFLVLVINIAKAQGNANSNNSKNPPAKHDAAQTGKMKGTNAASQKPKPKSKDARGQIYVGADWPMGIVELHNGNVLDKFKLRYNILTDRIQYIAGKDTLTFIEPGDIRTATFNGHNFIFGSYQAGTELRQGYFEVIVPGKNKLMLRRWVGSRQPDPKHPGDELLTRYQVNECYFISKPGLPAQKLACNRKSALAFLNDHNEDIQEYLRITGNKVRTIDDLKLLVSYYNSLDE